MSATAFVARRPAVTVWAIYSWPGGRWLVTAWSCSPGAQEAHGPLLWEGSLEAARRNIPPGLERSDPLPEDVDASPALVEFWR